MYIILAPSTFVCGATIVVSAIYISAYVVAAYGYMYTAVIPNITIYLKYIVCMSQASWIASNTHIYAQICVLSCMW